MIAVTVTSPTGEYYTRLFDRTEITVGRGTENNLVLHDDNVSTRHARITLRDGKFIIVDTQSTNGVYVNGRMATTPIVVNGPNSIHIAVFELSVSVVRV